jgi:dUTPase
MNITSNIGEAVKFYIFGDTKAPQRAEGDAGIDVFIPNLSETFMKSFSEKNPGSPFRWGMMGAPQSEEDLKNNKGVFLYLPAHEDVVIPTFVKTRFPDNLYLRVSNKSGVALHQKLTVGAEVIDSSYEGEILIHVFNSSNQTRFLEFGQKLAQLVPEVIDVQPIEIFYDATVPQFSQFKNTVAEGEFYSNHKTHRADAGFGEGTGKT